jgi:hypothetical protein
MSIPILDQHTAALAKHYRDPAGAVPTIVPLGGILMFAHARVIDRAV